MHSAAISVVPAPEAPVLAGVPQNPVDVVQSTRTNVERDLFREQTAREGYICHFEYGGNEAPFAGSPEDINFI